MGDEAGGGEHREIDLGWVAEKGRYFRGAGWFDEYCLPVEEELRKKNPNIKSYPFA